MTKPTFKILQEELEELNYKPVSLFDRLFMKATRGLVANQSFSYSFKVPISHYLRAELFCNDVEEVSEYEFTQHDLLDILLDDFMIQAKMRSNPIDIYKELHNKSLEQSISIIDGAQSLILLADKKERNRTIKCILTRKKALRLEVMLSDIADLELERTFTVNDVLQILYKDFVLKYKNGELTNILPKIIKRLSQESE